MKFPYAIWILDFVAVTKLVSNDSCGVKCGAIITRSSFTNPPNKCPIARPQGRAMVYFVGSKSNLYFASVPTAMYAQ